MGQSKDRAELVGKLGKAGAVITGPRMLQAATNSVKSTLERSAAQSGLRRGSTIARRPWRGVYVRRAGQGMAVGYARPAGLVNNRTRPHVIGARGLGTRTTIAKRVNAASLVGALSGGAVSASFKGRSGAKALKFPNGDFAAYAKHRGTAGKHFYERAKPLAAKDGARAAQTSLVTGLAGIFR